MTLLMGLLLLLYMLLLGSGGGFFGLGVSTLDAAVLLLGLFLRALAAHC